MWPRQCGCFRKQLVSPCHLVGSLRTVPACHFDSWCRSSVQSLHVPSTIGALCWCHWELMKCNVTIHLHQLRVLPPLPAPLVAPLPALAPALVTWCLPWCNGHTASGLWPFCNDRHFHGYLRSGRANCVWKNTWNEGFVFFVLYLKWMLLSFFLSFSQVLDGALCRAFKVQREFVSALQVTHLPLCRIFYFPWHRHQREGTTGF